MRENMCSEEGKSRPRAGPAPGVLDRLEALDLKVSRQMQAQHPDDLSRQSPDRSLLSSHHIARA